MGRQRLTKAEQVEYKAIRAERLQQRRAQARQQLSTITEQRLQPDRAQEASLGPTTIEREYRRPTTRSRSRTITPKIEEGVTVEANSLGIDLANLSLQGREQNIAQEERSSLGSPTLYIIYCLYAYHLKQRQMRRIGISTMISRPRMRLLLRLL